eukprot:gene13901-15349_t
MFMFGHYRIWMGVVPMLFSLQLIWRAHDDVSLQTGDNNTAVKSNLDLPIAQNISESGTFHGDDSIAIRVTNARTPQTEQDVSIKLVPDNPLKEFIAEAKKIGKLLFINFGLTGKLALFNLDTISSSEQIAPTDNKDESIGINWQELLGPLDIGHLISSTFLNMVVVMVIWYIHPVVMATLSFTLHSISFYLHYGCASFSAKMFKMANTALRPLSRPFSFNDVNKDNSSQLSDATSLINIKDPESLASLMVTTADGSNQSEASSSSYGSFQTSVDDEKRIDGSGSEEQRNVDVEEWLEDSLIGNGIQTNNRFSANNTTNNYLQVSHLADGGMLDGEAGINAEFEDNDDEFKTSTPDNSGMGLTNTLSWSAETGVYTPANLKRYLYNRYIKTQKLGLSCDEDLDESYISADDEQKRRQPNFGRRFADETPTNLEEFVNVAKSRIRNRMLNMSSSV